MKKNRTKNATNRLLLATFEREEYQIHGFYQKLTMKMRYNYMIIIISL